MVVIEIEDIESDKEDATVERYTKILNEVLNYNNYNMLIAVREIKEIEFVELEDEDDEEED
jgi:hypothetical protein